MRKISKILLASSLCCATLVHSQNKYAVILGINDYYQQPGVKHTRSLRGSVNDALFVQGLLLNRFGFSKANIFTMFDSAVTRPAVLTLMHRVLAKAAPGDAVLFYYSGHGAWMSNPLQLDTVKRKMSQAMVMSNLYAPGLGCLLTDEDMKTVFNKFVDKKVITTALFDCCYSGSLPAGYVLDVDFWNPPPYELPNKAMPIIIPVAVAERKQPTGCLTDSRGNLMDSTDTDGDGVPDCKDWELFTAGGMPVDSAGVAMISNANSFASTPDSLAAPGSKAFNLKDALTVNYSPKAKRPADREGSAFLSLAASSDVEIAAEITDESGLRRGAFTKTLLSVYNDNPSTLSVDSLMKKITASIGKQKYGQTPTYRFEKSRLTGNLIGLPANGFADAVTTKCIAVNNGTITFDKGYFAGLSKGNVLANAAGNALQLSAVYADSATAKDVSGLVKKGQLFTVRKSYVASSPMIKLYIPEAPFTVESFAAFFKKKIAPLAAQEIYADYYHPPGFAETTLLLFNSADKPLELHRPGAGETNNKAATVVLLPLPSYIVSPLKKLVGQNQNIELVNRPDKADFVLYLNCANASEQEKAAYVFYFLSPIGAKPSYLFSGEKFSAPTLQLDKKGTETLCQSLYSLATGTIRYLNHEGWINEQKRK